MAKYGRFDSRNKKRKNDKYRAERKHVRVIESSKRLSNTEIQNAINYSK